MRFSTAITVVLGFFSAAVTAIPLAVVERGLSMNSNDSDWTHTITKTPTTLEAIKGIREFIVVNPKSKLSFGFYSPNDKLRPDSNKAVQEEAVALVKAWIEQEFGQRFAERFEFRKSHTYPFNPLKDPIQFYIEMDELQKVYICAVSMVKKNGLILGIIQFHNLRYLTDTDDRILKYYKLIEEEDAQIQLWEMEWLRKE
ncbi:hypothetical protein FB446DRAFT_794582 [Lentinula raphanica]|nr:hypothetical protein FB446DRAFT_794582 [Lentinula raphanica]